VSFAYGWQKKDKTIQGFAYHLKSEGGFTIGGQNGGQNQGLSF
jgi:hypothetical protein